MFKAAVMTPYILSPDGNVPKIRKDYQLISWTDITGHPSPQPDPALLVIEIVCDITTLDAIEADPNYEVLSSEEVVYNAATI